MADVMLLASKFVNITVDNVCCVAVLARLVAVFACGVRQTSRRARYHGMPEKPVSTSSPVLGLTGTCCDGLTTHASNRDWYFLNVITAVSETVTTVESFRRRNYGNDM
jgi:hypothetical protein